ncbi:hypothetical protein [Rhizobium sp. 11515TR]|uniref:hypothetical protein n=1 Tax=Rhizobium sp. 11515TR TaxID=2028343 RepID=UPI000BA85F27|nr:hypothetical protein [Rhizobium sp. 11515TR]ASW09802.1 hypothetical protein CKA34_27640 [Rhizobium sp. 11515TR]
MTVLQEVNEILFRSWDPIGIQDIAPSDEYLDIAAEIVELFNEQADAHLIAQILTAKRTQEMKLRADNSADAKIAEHLAALLGAKKIR